MMATYDAKTKRWLTEHRNAETTVAKCDVCGLCYKPSLGHKCKKREQAMERKNYTSCRSPAATRQQEAEWNRMVQELEHRKAKENHRKEVKTNGRDT